MAITTFLVKLSFNELAEFDEKLRSSTLESGLNSLNVEFKSPVQGSGFLYRSVMEFVPRNYVQCENARESISRINQKLCPRNATFEDRAAKNTFYSSCSAQLHQPGKALYAEKRVGAPSWDQFSKFKPQEVCHGEVKPRLSSAYQQMSSFERACYEDFQVYIPEITAETQFTLPSNLCEEDAGYSIVPSGHPVVNQDCVPTHPNSSNYKVPPSARHGFYNEGLEPFLLEGSKNKTSRAPGNCNYDGREGSSHPENGSSWPQERHLDLSFSKNTCSRSLQGIPQALPNKVVNHYGQQMCPTVSIRVDISCPLSPCGCNNLSCCHRDSCTKYPMQQSYGNIPGNLSKRCNGVSRSNICQGLPRDLSTSTRSFTGKLSHTSSNNSSYNTGLSESQFKPGCYGETNLKPFPPSYGSTANNNGFSGKERLCDHVFYKCIAADQTSSQIVGSDIAYEKKVVSLNGRDQTFNSNTVKCEDSKTWWGRHIAEDFPNHKNSAINVKNGTFPQEGVQTENEGLYLSNTLNSMINPCQQIVELRPIDPEKIFGQCTFQTTGNTLEKFINAEPQKQTYLQSPPVSQGKVPVQAENSPDMGNGGGANGLLTEPSSPIVNLSNLVAKIHPDHGNMTGQKNVKMEGKLKVNLLDKVEVEVSLYFHLMSKQENLFGILTGHSDPPHP